MNMISDRQALYALLRQDFKSFIERCFLTLDGSQTFQPNWHIDVMADALAKAARGEGRRLIINVPPRHLKSMSASVALAAWILGHNPNARIVCVSYSDDLAAKHARDCRKVMETDWYRAVFPYTRLSPRRSATNDFETTLGGGRFSTSVGGSLTGRGGGWIIIDDPIKPEDALSVTRRANANRWFDNTLYSRLDNKETGVIILIMQRLHQDDLVGHVKDKEHWTHICLSAIAERDERFELSNGLWVGRRLGEALHPERQSLESLEAEQARVGSYTFQAQYQQCPVPECGNIIKWAWFLRYDTVPPSSRAFDRIVQSWDTASSLSENADYSVCTTWGVRGNQYYLIHVFRARLDFPSLKKKVIELKQQFGAPDVLIEDTGIGMGLIQQLRQEGLLRPIAIKPKGTKVERLEAQSAVIERGDVLIPKNAPWLDEFHSEILAFPGGKHDDQVDSLSQFLNWIGGARGGMRVLHVKI